MQTNRERASFYFQNKMIVNITIKGILLLMIFFPCSCVGYFNVDIIVDIIDKPIEKSLLDEVYTIQL